MARSGAKRRVRVTLPGGRAAEIVDVENPYGGRADRVQRVVDTSAIGRMYARGVLKAPKEQQRAADGRLWAANELSATFGRAGAGGAQAIDYSRVKVDISWRDYSTPASQAAAVQKLLRIHAKTGDRLFKMLESLVLRNETLKRYCETEYGTFAESRRGAVYQDVRDALDMVADVFGTAHGPTKFRR